MSFIGELLSQQQYFDFDKQSILIMALFCLKHDETYDKLCGQIFITTKGRIAYYCTFCEEYRDHESFLDHLLTDCSKFIGDNFQNSLKRTRFKRSKPVSAEIEANEELTQNISMKSKDSQDVLNIKPTKSDEHRNTSKLGKCLPQQNNWHKNENSFIKTFDPDYMKIEYCEDNLEEFTDIDYLEDEEIDQINFQFEKDLEQVVENEIDHNMEQFVYQIAEENQNSYDSVQNELIHITDDEIKSNDQRDSKLNEKLNSNVKMISTAVVVRNVRTRQKYHPSHIAPEERKYKCRVCGLGFKDSANMNYHMRRHTDQKPYSCKDCDKKFFTSTEVKSHSRVHNKLAKNFLCAECGEAFESNYRLLLHQKKRHTNQRDYICNVCNKGFFILKSLKKHLVSHSTERPYSCEICAARFKLTSGLTTHMKQHENKREYKCQFCEAAFNVQAALYCHTKSKHQKQ